MSELTALNLIIDIPGREDGVPLNFSVRSGEVWGVLGPNGAGKTTLLHTLAGLRAAREGEVHLDGRDLSQLQRRRVAQQLGVVFQERQDGFPATVMETALIGRHPYLALWDFETAEDVAIARRALAATGLEGFGNRLVSTLSGGERQRLAFATVLAQDPAIYLVDEPSNHLDLRHQVRVMELLAQQAAQGRGILLCLHDINLAARWCSHLLLLYPDGRASWGGADAMLTKTSLETLYDQPLTALEAGGAHYFVPASSEMP